VTRDDLEAAADKLLGAEALGKKTQLSEEWMPGDKCPQTGAECVRCDCWSDGECPLRPTLTSKLAAEAGRYLARWAADAGADGMCRGCAFREGTRANRTDGTIIDIVECLRTGAQFMCHEGLAHGELPKVVCGGWSALKAGLPSRELPPP